MCLAAAPGHAEEIVEHALLEPARILHAHHDLGEQVLEHARRREEIGGADLAPVLDHGLGALGAAHAHGRRIGLAVGEDVIADPGHRQVGEQDVVGPEAVELVAVLRRDDDVVVRQHHALGPAGGAGGVEHHADVGALALGDLVEPPALGAGVGAHLLAAQLLDVLEGMQVGRVVVREAARLVVDDLLQLRQPIGDRDHLVDLLLVLDDRELHLGVLEHVGHLVGHRVLVDRNGDAAEALHGGEGGIEARAVVADDGHRVAALEPELAQADGEGAHLVAQLRPGPGLPDAVVLVAHGRAVGVLDRVAQQQLGHGVERRGRRAAVRRRISFTFCLSSQPPSSAARHRIF